MNVIFTNVPELNKSPYCRYGLQYVNNKYIVLIDTASI